MFAKKTLKLIVLILFTMSFLLFVIFALNRQGNVVKLKLVSNEEINSFSEYVFEDYSEYIFNDNTNAAIDTETSTIYASVKKSSLQNSDFLNGLLTIRKGDEFVFYVSDANCIESMTQNQPLKVIIAKKDSKEYMQYNLVITTLPIINLDGGSIGTKNGRILNGGDFTIWAAEDSLPLQTSHAYWNVRGRSSETFAKKSFKIALKRYNEDNDMQFLGLGYDDEWILNGTAVDDTKIREKLLMDIWNQIQDTSTYNIKMSSAEYVELIINGQYKGLYLLQREINEKYLQLDNDMVLLRGYDEDNPESIYEAYSIEYSGRINTEEVYECMRGMFAKDDFLLLNKDNWIDTNLFTQFGRLVDNVSLRNTYYVLDNKKKEEKIHILLWDTDLAFGLQWNHNFIFNFDPHTDAARVEYSALLSSSPDILYSMTQRWKELRDKTLSYDNLLCAAEKYNAQIHDSGAILRDKNVNGLLHNGEDNYENLIIFIQEQLRLMDEIYLKG